MIADSSQWFSALMRSTLMAKGKNYCRCCGHRVIVDSTICWRCDEARRLRVRRTIDCVDCGVKIRARAFAKRCASCSKTYRRVYWAQRASELYRSNPAFREKRKAQQLQWERKRRSAA
jgi:hypothetical protein